MAVLALGKLIVDSGGLYCSILQWFPPFSSWEHVGLWDLPEVMVALSL